jgi:WD40 repeat protein
LWDVRSAREMSTAAEHEKGVVDIEFGPDGQRLLSVTEDGQVRLWRIGPRAAFTPVVNDVVLNATSAHFSPNGDLVVCATTRGAEIVDAETGSFRSVLKPGMAIHSARFSADNESLVTTDDDGATVWDPRAAEVVHRYPHRFATDALFSPSSRYVLTTGADGAAKLWSTESDTTTPIGSPLHQGGPIRSAAFSPDGQHIVMASRGREALLWDAQLGAPGNTVEQPGAFADAAISPDGRWFATAIGQAAQVWDVDSTLPVGKPLQHTAAINSIAWSPDSNRLVLRARTARRACGARRRMSALPRSCRTTGTRSSASPSVGIGDA